MADSLRRTASILWVVVALLCLAFGLLIGWVVVAVITWFFGFPWWGGDPTYSWWDVVEVGAPIGTVLFLALYLSSSLRRRRSIP